MWGSRLVRDGSSAGQETRFGLLLPGARAVKAGQKNGACDPDFRWNVETKIVYQGQAKDEFTSRF